jgi:uncharacterized repeat protein (TIGR03837 family)
MPVSWDIFCRVVDNFGDAGVCWRLAHQIALARGEPVRLWIDDLSTLAHVAAPTHPVPGATPAGVQLKHWCDPLPDVTPHDVVIEAFACGLPEAWLTRMAQRASPPVWINLEYLSSETWVEGCHRLQSRHPRLPLTQHFFFPGFTPRTGGLLREAGLIEALDAEPCSPDTFSLFCYANPALAALLSHWAQGPKRRIKVAYGLPQRAVGQWLGHAFAPGDTVEVGALTLEGLPFLPQPDYDRLLARCGLNFVRGEDSFVRAQWAAQPMVWHIYPQADDAHQVKLNAFLDRLLATLPKGESQVVRRFWQAWNDGDGAATVAAWPAFDALRPMLRQHMRDWRQQLVQQVDLLSQLADFVDHCRAGH